MDEKNMVKEKVEEKVKQEIGPGEVVVIIGENCNTKCRVVHCNPGRKRFSLSPIDIMIFK